MKYILKLKNYFFLFTIISIIKISLLESNKNFFLMKISRLSTELESFHIDTDENNLGDEWVPSLLSPLLIVPASYNIPLIPIGSLELITSPLFADTFSSNLYNISFLGPKYNVTLAKEKISNVVDKCYFGLSGSLEGFNGLNENQIILNQLKNNNEIKEKIFTFDKWVINDDLITSNLYFGQTNDNFKSGKGIIGSCKSDFENLFWGCSFMNMSINETNVELKNDILNETYKIYFTSENHNIIIPLDFKEKFDLLTKNCCYFNSIDSDEQENELSCDQLFEKDDYFTIKLINGNMNITIEIDNLNKYTLTKEKKNKTRIRFEKQNYFMFPLIMFKKFDIQFDADNNLISFYTTDESILEVEKKKNNDKKESSTGLKVFLVFLIIILIIGLVFILFFFIKKRRGSIEKNINKYSKFEDDENFQNMNEKRVF